MRRAETCAPKEGVGAGVHARMKNHRSSKITHAMETALGSPSVNGMKDSTGEMVRMSRTRRRWKRLGIPIISWIGDWNPSNRVVSEYVGRNDCRENEIIRQAKHINQNILL